MPNEPQKNNPQQNPNADFEVIAESASNESVVTSASRDVARNEAKDFEDLKKQRYSSDTADRQWLAVWTAIIVTLWLMAVAGILICNYSKFHLSDTVLTVLLGTTTLNVLGLSFIVLRGHFQSSNENKEER